MPNLVNKMVVREFTREVKDTDGMLLLGVGGLTVIETEKLRGELAHKGLRLQMVRRRLARKVLEQRGYTFPEAAYEGSLGWVLGKSEGAIDCAKVLKASDLLKKGRLQVRAGVLEGQVLSGQDAIALANVPDRKTLQAQLLGLLSGPARALATLLQANPSSLARVLQAKVDQAGAAAEAPVDEQPGAEAPAAN